MSTETAAEPARFSHREIVTIITGLMLGMLLAALDQTIVATSIRTIADDLDGYSLQAWVTTAYLIAATITTPLYGKLSDMYGRKPFFLAAITIFIVGSVLCTVAGSMYQLAAFRAVQGVGAGGLMSLALTIIGDIVGPRERARYQGYFLAMFGTASVLGPLLGGLFAGQAEILGVSGWRWVFLVNVPVGGIALLVVYRVLHLPKVTKPGVRVDWWGALVLAIAVAPLLVVAEQGRLWGWSSPKSLACYVIGAAGIAAFVAAEARLGDAALIPLRLFKNATFALGVVISAVVGAAMFGGITLLPQYLQVVRGNSPTVAGLQMLPLMLGLMCGSVLSGQLISRTGRYRIFTLLGAPALAAGFFLLHYLGPDTPLWMVMSFMALAGLGLGNLLQPITLAMQNSSPPKDLGVATASSTFFRQLGGTAGVAIFLSILFAQLPSQMGGELRTAAGDPQFRAAVAAAQRTPGPDQQLANSLAAHDVAAAERVLDDSSVIQRLNPVLAHPFKAGFADAMATVFLCAMGVSLLALLLLLFWKELPLRTTGGIAAREQAADTKPTSTGPPDVP